MLQIWRHPAELTSVAKQSRSAVESIKQQRPSKHPSSAGTLIFYHWKDFAFWKVHSQTIQRTARKWLGNITSVHTTHRTDGKWLGNLVNSHTIYRKAETNLVNRVTVHSHTIHRTAKKWLGNRIIVHSHTTHCKAGKWLVKRITLESHNSPYSRKLVRKQNVRTQSHTSW